MIVMVGCGGVIGVIGGMGLVLESSMLGGFYSCVTGFY